MMKTYQTIGQKTLDTDIDLDAIRDIAIDEGKQSKLNAPRRVEPYNDYQTKSTKYQPRNAIMSKTSQGFMGRESPTMQMSTKLDSD